MSIWVGGTEITNASGVYVGGTLCEGVYVGATKVWPVTPPFTPIEVGPFYTSGSYTTPAGATKCDVIIVGGGAGGDFGGAGMRTGIGGFPGIVNFTTIVPPASISYTIGVGGSGGKQTGAFSASAPTSGGTTACSGITAAGGAARGGYATGQDPTGVGTGLIGYNGRTYPGSASVGDFNTSANPGYPGNRPGGGGGGGKGVVSGFSNGGDGGTGCVYLYFYT